MHKGCSMNYPHGVDGKHFFVLWVEGFAKFCVLGIVGSSGGLWGAVNPLMRIISETALIL
jgi:hypothetical protein